MRPRRRREWSRVIIYERGGAHIKKIFLCAHRIARSARLPHVVITPWAGASEPAGVQPAVRGTTVSSISCSDGPDVLLYRYVHTVYMYNDEVSTYLLTYYLLSK